MSSGRRRADELLLERVHVGLSAEHSLEPLRPVPNLAEASDQALSILLRRGDGGPGRQSGDAIDVVAAKVRARRIELERHPDVRFRRRKIVAVRHDADHLEGSAVELDRAADHAGITAEHALPQVLAHERQP